ncbi:Citrate-sodium symporter [Caenorhabditis elegans]|uniref:Citrate-sodium symporter n=1 Tax=Caenorhabditis elegans TaxID=6239 RepID=G4S101_CAEEL|nr:Citrate-sodium symporter [Caenorhabditis elegans]CCD64922.2 Citrate-sodium symporter [Caenorhabditis elegans]
MGSDKENGNLVQKMKITLGTDQDPYNKEELVNTLKGRELGFFVIFYIFAVMCIVMAFEFFKPIIFTDNYPN